ncbi:MAG: alpha-glucan family phosphorylase, partial [Rikenellaceae bacterium]
MANTNNLPQKHLFEISWEVCNKVGGIHTVIASKTPTVHNIFGGNYIVMGPSFNKEVELEFDEDTELFKEWKLAAYNDGIRVRVGRWKIEDSPIAILVDFASYATQKDEILGKLWDSHQVDSLNEGWHYAEPVIFGYAAARAIESFVSYYGYKKDEVIAHFHEWMTASGGLTLNTIAPYIATTFTTHATAMGRSIAGNGLNLYDDMSNFNVAQLAARFNMTSMYSIEKISAESYDCFTTVSDITSYECKYMVGKEADVVTPNGFDDKIVGKGLNKKRKGARAKLINVAETSLGIKYDKEPLIVGTSGRYEFRNKGLDQFIDTLALLNDDETLGRDILAYILVPGWSFGPRKDLQQMLETDATTIEQYYITNLTHYIGEPEHDAILCKLASVGLSNKSNGRVNIMLVPAYLDGIDGIFNEHYYNILSGFDVTLFPSYYEPWGYTPLESIAFGVPSLTTSLSGFGKWIQSMPNKIRAVEVVERNDSNHEQVKFEMSNILRGYTHYTAKEWKEISNEAIELSKQSLWKNLYSYYLEAYDMAIAKKNIRIMSTKFNDGGNNSEQATFIKQQLSQSSPNWRRVMIERILPERLQPLEELSRNLWWSWTLDARQLFETIDPALWDEVERNPIAMLDNLSSERLKEIEKDEAFLASMDKIYAEFCNYMSKKENRGGDKIAYFSMEYGLHSSLKIYSGGLGILAGDYLKEASDKNINMTAVGLLYRYGYFTQKLSMYGEQEATYEAQNFYKLPIVPLRDESGKWLRITLNYPGRVVTARIWRCDVGRTELYLLDTDHNENMHEDKSISHHLYGGDWENRLKQEILLGIGGIKALNKIGIESDIFHCNEGHAAFIGLRRCQDLIANKGLSFSEALEVVRSSSLFTTHTPVPAGHDAFPEDMMRQYFSSMPDALKIDWEQFINLGKTNVYDHNERFSMSVLACNMSQEVNGVSWLHGEVSKEILANMWPNYFKNELHIGYVTNGVHAPTWTATNLRRIYNEYMGPDLETHNYDKAIWKRIYDVPDAKLWEERMFLKRKLINHVKNRVLNPEKSRIDSPAHMVQVAEALKPETLTIGFARRFATYKRAHLLFTNLERLEKIVNNAERPVQFVFAGKAHPNDKPGQDLIKRIVEISKLPQFTGKIVFIQNYDMELARRMVQGVDVWMNTPTRPL